MGSNSSLGDDYWRHIRWGSSRADVNGDEVIDMKDFYTIYQELDMHK
ncbi:hypothetical protein JCM19231_389 [Vibrio ishigakensis]|uniref:Uncharacterized protein n=2 Tax=Vibrio ishigakensis TaxID=1481914 RepID=A0A0B8NZ42_9VIBR|nr:hypothetical protein JCM19231_389 [Vibrio ishigakensis]